MKFKTIFLLFNIVVLFSFLFVVFMPLFLAGAEYAGLFWSDNWYLGVFFLLAMTAINIYFITNRKVFNLLESEDWPGLVSYLEHVMYEEGKINKQKVRLLLNTYLVLSRTDGVRRLEALLREKKRSLVTSFALPLGLPYLLSNDPPSMERFYTEFLNDPRVSEKNWIRFNYAFSLVLQRKLEEAAPQLFELSAVTSDPVIQILSSYFLASFFPADIKAHTASETSRSYLAKRFSAASWKRKISASTGNLEIVVLMQLIREAEEWVWGEPSGAVATAE